MSSRARSPRCWPSGCGSGRREAWAGPVEYIGSISSKFRIQTTIRYRSCYTFGMKFARPADWIFLAVVGLFAVGWYWSTPLSTRMVVLSAIEHTLNLPSASHPEDYPSNATENRTVVKSYSLLPTQHLTLTNSSFRDITLQSEYPVSVIVGNCESNYTVQFHCSSDPHDIFITDKRPAPIFTTPRANSITVTLSAF